jgi:methyltransferase (TIGR00027 family)
MPDSPVISHVSDTARWVATYRAMESERPDALFHDPFARRLAGVEGQRIVDTLPQGRRMAWPMVVRTAVLDELIGQCLRDRGVEAVLNLAAGLDARPWRMDLPASLQWTDVDHPAMIEYKTTALQGQTPRCDYRAVGLDLADEAGRRGLFTQLGQSGRRTLVVTEGLLVYLTEPAVTDLAGDLHAQASFTLWLTDLASPGLLRMLARSWGSAVAAGNAPFQFGPADGPAFFGGLGWKETAYRSMFHEGIRLKRTFPMARFWAFLGRFASQRRQQEFRRFSVISFLERA